MADITLAYTTCPVCTRISLREHCDSRTCPNWWRCINKACQAIIDHRHHRGVALVNGRFRRVEL